MTMRLLFTLQYLGTRYAGWQTQANATGIQQVVEGALTTLYKQPIRIEGAGRTDAGVHARAQRAHADLPFDIPQRGLLLGLNDLLPHDIRVTAVEPVADDFHCRFAATSKTYRYQIWNAPVDDVFAHETHAHVPPPLRLDAMREAAASLEGRHDFAAYTVANPEVATTVRTITSLTVEREGEAVHITATADGFLRYMVRRIAGTLIEAGRGRLHRASFEEARWTAPAKGLILWEVGYATPLTPSANIPLSR